MIRIDRIPAFQDNYIWALTQGTECVVVDPGDAGPVLAYLQAHSYQLVGILLTHWHGDHQGGVDALKAAFPACAVYGSAKPLKGPSKPLGERDQVELLGAVFQVLETPGHTLDHITYVSTSPVFETPVAFTGDTLFAGGCGRLFEGTALQMFESLAKINQLPANTAIYCAHEYTLANLQFAVTAEPEHAPTADRLSQVAAARDRDEPTVPTTLAIERDTNPFLRAPSPEVLAARRHAKDEF